MTEEQDLKSKQKPKSNQKAKAKRNSTMPKWARITLRVLKIAGIPLLCLLALYIGLYIGYAKLGDQPAGDIFAWGTWQHLFDLVFAE